MTGLGSHKPVLVAEIVAALTPRDDAIIVDATFGAGGYARAILAAAHCRVFGIDRDPEAVARGEAMAAGFEGRLVMLAGRFSEMADLLAERGVGTVDGVALDLGVSSPQIDDPERGFSFRFDGPLDMRMERDGATAADAVNSLPEATLADIIWRYGEERHARRIARAIVAERRLKPFATTGNLAELVRREVPRSKDGIDPATRTFQALRIHVNDEIGELDRGLVAAEALLRQGGRLAVVAFHSLEDRTVKEFIRRRSAAVARPSRHLPPVPAGRAPSFQMIGRRPVTPGAAEIAANPRARSARLRVAERTAAPAWGMEGGQP